MPMGAMFGCRQLAFVVTCLLIGTASSQHWSEVPINGVNLSSMKVNPCDDYNLQKIADEIFDLETMVRTTLSTTQSQFDGRVEQILNRLADSNCVISTRAILSIFASNAQNRLAVLVGLSKFGSTDMWISKATAGGNVKLFPVLLMSSIFNTRMVPYKILHEITKSNPDVTHAVAKWYSNFLVYDNCLPLFIPFIHQNARDYLKASPYMLQPPGVATTDSMFYSSYIDDKLDRTFKSAAQNQYNFVVGEVCGGDRVLTPPEVSGRKLKVGVASAFWGEGSSVFRNFKPLVEELATQHELWFVNNHPTPPASDTPPELPNYFTKSVRIYNSDGLSKLCELDVLLFIDVGMTDTSLLMANTRLATVQLATYGHSISTFGAKEVDYWLAGKDVEDLSMLTDNFSEKVLLISGPGVYQSARTPRGSPRILQAPKDIHGQPIVNPPTPQNPFVISMLWTIPKISSLAVRTLAQIVWESGVPVALRAYLSLSHFDNPQFKLWQKALTEELALLGVSPGTLSLSGLVSAQEYVQGISDSDLIIDGIPYGGCTSVFDALWSGVPVVQLEGTAWHNRVGPYHTRFYLGDELANMMVAKNEEEFVAKSVDLIKNPVKRYRISQALTSLPDSKFTEPGEITKELYPMAIRRAWEARVEELKNVQG